MKNLESKQEKRVLARHLAKEMTKEQLQAVTGGTTSCSSGSADDCDKEK